ncbi:MAG: serine hydrolase [bacterium]
MLSTDISPAKWCVLAGVMALLAAVHVTADGRGPGPVGNDLRALIENVIDPADEDPIHNAVLLVEGPGFKYKGAAGQADGAGEPMTPDHAYKIASISKTFTSAVVLQLVEEGVLGLDDTLDEFFASSPVVPLDTLQLIDGVSYGRRVTIEHLLGHTSGLGCYLGGDPRFIQYIIEHPRIQWTPAMMMDKYFEYHLNRKPAFAPGEGWEYTDTNYMLLGLIIEKVTGTPLHEQYRTRIFEPLGLDNSYLEYYEEPRGEAPLSHAFYGSMNVSRDVNTSFDWGGGGIVSTTEDLNTFYRALLKGELFEKRSTLDAMLAATVKDDHWNYGFGIKRMIIGGRTFYGHPGAYSCDAYYCPEEDMSVVLTINQMNSKDRKETLRTKAVQILLGGAAGAGSDEVGSRMRSVENGLCTAFMVDGHEEFQKTYNIYERMKHYQVPGVSIAVINGGRIEWAEGYGELEAGTGRMVDTETLFQVASIGKPVTSAGALRLVEKGVFDLDVDVNRYLRSWRLPENEFTGDRDVTLEMLLSHSAGTTVHGFPGYPKGSDLPTLVEVLDGTPPCNTPPVRVDLVPGTQWRYSGGGFMVLQQMFEDVLGEPFEDAMRELVFEPAGMTRTFYSAALPAELEENAAFAYLADGTPVDGGYHLYPEYGAGAGLWSTPSDLARFAVEIQKSYSGEAGSLLKKETARDMLTWRVGHYGLGLAVSSGHGEVMFTHSGGNRGYRNLLAAYARTGKGAVIMTNSDAGDHLYGEILRAIAVTYDWPDYQPEKKNPAVLTEEQLNAVTGNYDLPGLGTLPFWVEDGRLYAPDPGTEGARVLLLPESPMDFFSPAMGWTVTFRTDDSGDVTGFDAWTGAFVLSGTRQR